MVNGRLGPDVRVPRARTQGIQTWINGQQVSDVVDARSIGIFKRRHRIAGSRRQKSPEKIRQRRFATSVRETGLLVDPPRRKKQESEMRRGIFFSPSRVPSIQRVNFSRQ